MRYLNNFYLYPDELAKNRDIEQIDDHSFKAYDRWLNLFNPKSIRNLLQKIDFKVNKIETPKSV